MVWFKLCLRCWCVCFGFGYLFMGLVDLMYLMIFLCSLLVAIEVVQ